MGSALFRGVIDKLEVARGYDGFLRGGPDPVLVAGIYAVTDKETRLVGRSLHRFESKTQFPTEVKPNVTELPAVRVETDLPVRFLMLAIMLEEDGGQDVQRLYGAVEHQALLSVYEAEHSDVDPVSLGAFSAKATSKAPTRVEMLVEGQPASSACKSDKWIGAVGVVLESRALPAYSLYRLPYLAPDRKNDWTLIVTLQH